jgi:hypothetical protein
LVNKGDTQVKKYTLVVEVGVPENIPKDVENLIFNIKHHCQGDGMVVRWELHELDAFDKLNAEAINISKNQALIELEEEILNSKMCLNGNCED